MIITPSDHNLEKDRVIYAYLVHIIPLKTDWLKLITCDVLLIPRHVYNVAIGGTVYAVSNFLIVKFLKNGDLL